MYANVLKFHILISHKEKETRIRFRVPIISHFRVISLLIRNTEISLASI